MWHDFTALDKVFNIEPGGPIWIEEGPTLCWGEGPSWNSGKAGTYTYECLHKTYTIEEPDGTIVTISGLTPYCREKKLNAGHLHGTLTGHRRNHKKYRIIPQTEEESQASQGREGPQREP